MRIEFHPAARLEFIEAVDYYECRSLGLGKEYADEIEAALQSITEDPQRWRCLEEDVRRKLLKRFPYGVLYTVETDYLLIIALMHFRRKPGYWRQRL